MRLSIKYISTTLATVAMLAISSLASADYLESKTDAGIVYSLFATPNKILRYNMASEAKLDSISLSKAPTAFTIANGIAYVAFHRELRAINLTSGADQFIKNTSTDINELLAVGQSLIVLEQSGSMTTLSAIDFHLIETTNIYNPLFISVVSNLQSAIYYTNGSYLQKLPLDNSGKAKPILNGVYSGGSTSIKSLFINTSQNKIYDNAGNIYFADALISAGNLSGSFDQITFIDNNPIAISGNKLKIFTAESVALGEITLPTKPVFAATYTQKAFTFSLTNDDLAITISDLSNFKLPAIGQAVNPVGFAYVPEFYAQDAEGNIYAVDKESLSVFRWSSTSNSYLETWTLSVPPTSVTYSSAHKRLYIGYADGSITYFSSTESNAKQHSFTSMATGVHSLMAIGDYLLATDSSTWPNEYILNIDASITSSNINYSNPTNQYVWGPANQHLYRLNANYVNWVELNPTTGMFITSNLSAPYLALATEYPIILSEDGQYLLTGSGQLMDALNLSIVNSLSNSIRDGVWVNGKLITINKTSLAIEFWGSNYELLHSYPLPDALNARLLKVGSKILLIQEQRSGPNFTLYDPENLPDSDKDGVNDLIDNCPTTANADQADFDGDGQGNVCDNDADNDGISDIVEINSNLNPLNASDATNDLDKDGFSNATENLQGSSLTDAKSIPKALSNYYENFESGWPSGFSASANSLPWKVISEGYNSSHALISSSINNATSFSEISFTTRVNAGMFSFQYMIKTDNGSYYNMPTFSLVVDGTVTAQLGWNYNNTWQTFTTDLAAGVHTISFLVNNPYSNGYDQSGRFVIDDVRFQSNPDNDDSDGDGLGRKYDNCPNVANLDQSDIDSDGIGDACDPVDNRPKDTDGDGIYDSSDNCLTVKNPQQQNMDGDKLGDACDDDIDGDGVTNTIEKTFTFMNEKDATDVLKDQDGDGVNNGYEIAHSTKPDVADNFPSISLFDYYPLGEINLTYLRGSEKISSTQKMTKSTIKDNYDVIDSDSRGSFHLERRDSGIYLTKETYSYGTDINNITFVSYLLFPSTIKLGQIITTEGTMTENNSDAGAINNPEPTKVITTFELIATGQTQWQGKSYPSITLKKHVQFGTNGEYSEEAVYLKGIGQVSQEGYSLDKIEIISLDKSTEIAAPAETSTKAGKKSGGGTVDIVFMMILTLISLLSRREKISGTRQAPRYC